MACTESSRQLVLCLVSRKRMHGERPSDSFEFWARFVFGAVVGSGLGFLLWLYILPRAEVPWMAVPIAVIACGLAAAWWGDRFWYALLRCFRLW